MKKLLITTTALVSMVSFAAFAEGEDKKLDVKLGGVLNLELGGSKQSKDYMENVTPLQKNFGMYGDARVSAKVEGVHDAGFKYGGVVALKVNAIQRNSKDSKTFDNTYAYLDTAFGRVEVGSNYSASRNMRVSGGSLARGTGGATGDYTNFIAGPLSYKGDGYKLSGGLLSDSIVYANSSGNGLKTTVYTPRVYGLQFGLSYTPDTLRTGFGNAGASDKAYNGFADRTRGVKNLFNAGLNYNDQFGDVGVRGSVVGEYGKGQVFTAVQGAEDDTKTTLRGYEVGAAVSYAGFSVGGSYGNSSYKFYKQIVKSDENGGYQDSLGHQFALETDSGATKNPTYFDVAVSYEYGPFGASVNYLQSKFFGQKSQVTGVAFDYALAPGMLTYAEFAHYKLDKDMNDKSNKVNKGNAYFVGTQLTF